MAKLGVNIDHVATLRQARGGTEPDPVYAARICEASGADSIVAHLREDRRHIKDRDLELLRQTLKGRLNLEMSVNKEIVDIACRILPDQCTLVPERRKELTTEGGLDVAGKINDVSRAVRELRKAGIEVSLFIDPDKRQIKASKDIGAGTIELHTGNYAQAQGAAAKKTCLKQIKECALFAKKAGLTVSAGHGLDYLNTAAVAQIKEIEEFNIGYSIICRALFIGLEQAVRQMKSLVEARL
jgi:pyridoxine 5-phosphate synthase